MFTESRIAGAMQAMVLGIEAPPVPLDAIRRRILLARPQHVRRFYAAAAAAAAALVLALPRLAPGFTQTIEQQVEAITHWTPPPPAPASVESAMRLRAGTLAAAQARVDFTIVPPAGLPRDVVSEKIATIPTGVYSYAMHRWSVGRAAVWFIYKRAGGREFTLLADRFDPREGAPSKRIFEADERKWHDKFTWLNGDQVTSAIADETISATEIERIRTAMRGAAVRGFDPHASIVKQYRLP
jgi:hypothetical protein